MTQPRRHDESADQPSAYEEIERARRLADGLRVALSDGGTAPTDAATLATWISERVAGAWTVAGTDVDALVALGILGRLVSGDETRLVWTAGPSPTRPGTELGRLAVLAQHLAAALRNGSVVADDPTVVAALVAAEARGDVSRRRLDALCALGVLGRVESGGATTLVWMRDGWAAHAVAAGAIPDLSSEAFKLDVAIDVEHERLLLYRIAFVVEVIAAVVIVRQLILGLS